MALVFFVQRARSVCLTITWSRSLMGQGFSISVADSCNESLCKVDNKPSLFSKKKVSKSLEVSNIKVGVFWDLSVAKFTTGPKPLEGFYVAILFDQEMVLFLGDLRDQDAYKKTKATPPSSNTLFVSRREHLFGRRTHSTRAQFCDNGQFHDIVIECETMLRQVEDPSLVIRIDRKRVMEVKHLRWKFRGKQTVLVGKL